MLEARILAYLPLAVLLAWAAVTDVRDRRIPNWITFSLLCGGLLGSLMNGGVLHPREALGGIATGFGLGIIIHVMGGLAAGDVKLLTAIGAWVGSQGALTVFAVSAIVSLIFVLGQCLMEHKLKSLLINTGQMVLLLAMTSREGVWQAARVGRGYQSVSRPLPYALMLLIGAAAFVFYRAGAL